tara:strand:- start:757 stop:1110 length:354 start_codon:yes stop_codon:yes gene_type:complete
MIELITVGIDIVDINRFRKLNYKKNTRFFNRIFSQSEINYCLKFKNSAEHFAGKFAVKESVRKCIGKSIKFVDIITTHQKNRPKVKIKNQPQYSFEISISHEKNVAVAVVLCEKLIS